MKSSLCLLLAAGLLTLAGCSSTPTRTNHGPIQARTFSFFKTDAKAPPSFADSRAELHPRIQEAITRNLAAKGLTKVPAGGDITVAYMIIVSDGGVTTSINDYFGYRDDSVALQDKAHKAFAIDNKNPTPYPAGTLVIDLIDGKTYQLAMRNHVSRPMLRQLPMEERLNRLQEAVDEVLKDLRLAK